MGRHAITFILSLQLHEINIAHIVDSPYPCSALMALPLMAGSIGPLLIVVGNMRQSSVGREGIRYYLSALVRIP